MKTQIILPEDITEVAVNELKERLLKEMGDNIVTILFFGSRQKGAFAPDSDIDILVVIKEKTRAIMNRIFDIADEIEHTVLTYKIPFSIHIQSKDEFKRFKGLKSLFIREVEKKGRVVYGR